MPETVSDYKVLHKRKLFKIYIFKDRVYTDN